MNRLVETVAEGDQALLVIFTDGEFDPVPNLAQARASIARYAERSAAKRATLRVEFLLIAPGDAKTVEAVRQQGIRDALLKTFNGDAQSGSYEVTDINRLTQAMKDVIADVAATDRQKQSQYITMADRSLTLDSPLSLTRLMSVATAPIGQSLPHLRSVPAAAGDSRVLAAAMEKADTALALRNQQLHGVTEQMSFSPPYGRDDTLWATTTR